MHVEGIPVDFEAMQAVRTSTVPAGLEMAQFDPIAAAESFDMDNDVEEIPNVDRVPIFNPSGNQMVFKGAVRLTVEVDGGSKRTVAFFVLKGSDGMLVLGTNVLKSLGYELQRPRVGLSEQNVTEVPQLRTTKAGAKSRPRRTAKAQRTKSDNRVKVVSRLYIKPGETKTIDLSAAVGSTESVLWSSDKLVPNELIVAAVANEPNWTQDLRKDVVYGEVIRSVAMGNILLSF
ncbi:unnamed protein product [Heligmosomoides polygyrus]|uniref:HlyD_D23 domain-containing protein n=1 Tax=Heligmosomoides polygyrus TaxID=6339 RepID=A0A183FAA6_HELPZ|nr:unnamed protein product [Heligmosomoides polygyrus]